MKNVKKTGTRNESKTDLKAAICEALFSYVLNKTGIFPKGMRNRCLFWANY